MAIASQTSPVVIDSVRRMQHTQLFLKMAAAELSRLAEKAPEIAVELQHVARQLRAEIEDLASRDTQKA